MANILILDDDRAHRRALGEGLSRHHGHAVRSSAVWAVGGVLSDLLVPSRLKPDLVIIDPYGAQVDGLSLVRMVRTGSGRPVIVASARGSDADEVAALRAGADAVVPKPCSVDVVHALLGALLRRAAPVPVPSPSTVGGLWLDPATREVTLHGVPVALTRAEFDLLACLLSRPGRVISRARLAAAGFGSVDVMLSRLRAKLGETAREPGYLRTYRGKGVAIRNPVPA